MVIRKGLRGYCVEGVIITIHEDVRKRLRGYCYNVRDQGVIVQD